jgi:membrane protein insertase Oxa1/YidC/SpoIIIJ
MLKRLFESMCDLLQAMILVQLLFAAAVAVALLLYFVVMTSFRVIQAAWTHLFSRPFP